MRIAVTGAGGFIGRRVVTELARTHEVTALGHDGAGGIDVRRPETLVSLANHDVVVHAAAYVPRVHDDPAEAATCLEVNALGTLAVLRRCQQAGVGRVVLLSGGNLYRRGDVPATESAPIAPAHRAVYYLSSKAVADFYAEHFDRELGLPVAILRPSAVYGPGLDRGMIAAFTTNLLAGRPILVDDGGRYRADFVHVDDVASAVARTIERGVRGAVNLGGGETASALEIAHLLAELTGAAPSLVHVAPATGSGPVGFPPLDIAHARSVLGYEPRTLRDGLASYVAHRREGA